MARTRRRPFAGLAAIDLVVGAAVTITSLVATPAAIHAAGAASAYRPVGPCRLADTRTSEGSFGY